MAGTFYQAYVEIIPVAKNFKQKLESEMGGLGAASTKAGQESGGFFSNAFSAGFRGLAIAGTAAVTAIGGGLAATLTKGFDRLQGIERARNLLQGIGFEARTVEEVMTNALASVRGTAFGLDEAAQIAASSVAAGVKPGQELERYLRLTGDAASVTGRSMGDLGAIFTKVTASGKAQNDILGQLAESGIPIYQYLAEQLGVTSSKIFDMAKEGEIGTEILLRAIETNVSGAALKAGETTQGAFANVGAAISRVGANILSGTFSQLPTFFGSLIEAIGPLEDAAKGLGSELGEALAPVFENVISLLPIMFEAFVSFMPLFVDLIDLVVRLFPTILELVMPLIPLIQTLADVFLKVLDAVLPLMAEMLNFFLEIIEPLIPALVGLVDLALEPLMAVFGEVLDAAKLLWAWFSDNIPTVAAFAGTVALLTLAFNGIRIATAAWAAVQAVLNAVMVMNPIGLIIVAIAALVAGIVWLATKTQFFQTIWSGLVVAFEAVMDWLKAFPGMILDFFAGIPDLLMDFGKFLLEGLLEGVKLGFKLLEFWFIDLPVHIISFFLRAGRWIYDNGGDIMRGLWEGIKNVWNTVVQWFIDLPGNIRDSFVSDKEWLAENGSNIIQGMKDGIVEFWAKVVQWFMDLPGNIKDFFVNAAVWLFDIGGDIIGGLFNGIKNAWTAVKNWVSEKIAWIIDSFKDALEIQSPSKVFYGFGEMIGEGLVQGMKSMSKDLDTTVSSMISMPTERDMTYKGLKIADMSRLSLGSSDSSSDNREGRTVNYYAAENKSFDAEQELLLAMRRVPVIA